MSYRRKSIINPSTIKIKILDTRKKSNCKDKPWLAKSGKVLESIKKIKSILLPLNQTKTIRMQISQGKTSHKCLCTHLQSKSGQESSFLSLREEKGMWKRYKQNSCMKNANNIRKSRKITIRIYHQKTGKTRRNKEGKSHQSSEARKLQRNRKNIFYHWLERRSKVQIRKECNKIRTTFDNIYYFIDAKQGLRELQKTAIEFPFAFYLRQEGTKHDKFES